MDISHLTINGLKNIEMQQGEWTVIGMKLNITVLLPKLTVSVDYKGDFVLLDVLPLYGDGSLKFSFSNCFEYFVYGYIFLVLILRTWK